jgi:hypothetical protein
MSVDIFTQTQPTPMTYNFCYGGVNTPLTIKASTVNCVSYSSTLSTYSPLNWLSPGPIYATTFAVEGMSYSYNYNPSLVCAFRVPINILNGSVISFIVF